MTGSGSSQATAARIQATAMLEEIFLGEVLTRVWTAVLVAHAERQQFEDGETIGRNIFLGHQEARNRALRLLVEAPGINPHEAVALNRTRRKAERWSDLLVGHLATSAEVCQFAVSPDRARDFATDLLAQGYPGRHAAEIWKWTLAGLRIAFRQNVGGSTSNGELNAQVAAGVLGCFSAETFDSIGLFQSLWMARLKSTAADAEVRLNQLFREEAGTSSAEPALGSQLPPCRRRFPE